MASISNVGVGSGLDLQSLLTSLQTNEEAALQPITNQATSFQSKLSGYGQVKSVLAAYQTAAQALADAKTFSATKPVVGDSTIFSATASSSAVPGSYTVNVTSLAAAQTLVTTQQASQTAAVGGGTLTFDFGDQLATGGAATSTKTVTIGSDTSMQGIRDSINKANIGVTASIINDGSGTPYRLVLTSNNTGTQGTMRVSASDSNVNALVAFDPASAVQASGVQQKVAPQNAALTINGIDIVSQTNSVTDAAQGVTLSLTKTGTTSLTVNRDSDSIVNAVQAFVTAYNNVLTTAAQLTAFDTSSNKPGDPSSGAALNGDNTLSSIQSRLRAMLNAPLSDGKGGTINLSDIGVSFNMNTGTGNVNYGKMTVDTDKLKSAISGNLQGLTSLFSGTSGGSGIGKQVSDYVDSLNATSGALTVATDGITATLKQLNDQYNETNDRITATMDRYRAQFTQLDLLVSQMNQTKSYLTQQFASLSSSSK
ncbi:flagellar filament capping protein FliD [Cupriavidus sp. RAF12]|uniref:flagellar filament capping protein FliD n=1 Tax=Cupriavidus sp. RAF12 TaxID=3233050 RepID=UPI003F930238